MLNGLSPTMHPDYEMQTRVAFSLTGKFDEQERTGKIIGVAFAHVVFAYIVLLDEPLESHPEHTAIPVLGSLIKRVL